MFLLHKNTLLGGQSKYIIGSIKSILFFMNYTLLQRFYIIEAHRPTQTGFYSY